MKQFLVTEIYGPPTALGTALHSRTVSPIPPGAKVLTREQVTTAYILATGSEYPLSDMLDELFGADDE